MLTIEEKHIKRAILGYYSLYLQSLLTHSYQQPCKNGLASEF